MQLLSFHGGCPWVFYYYIIKVLLQVTFRNKGETDISQGMEGKWGQAGSNKSFYPTQVLDPKRAAQKERKSTPRIGKGIPQAWRGIGRGRKQAHLQTTDGPFSSIVTFHLKTLEGSVWSASEQLCHIQPVMDVKGSTSLHSSPT